MKHFALLVLAILSASITIAQPSSSVANDPKPVVATPEKQVTVVAPEKAASITYKSPEDVLLLKELEYNFGKIPQGKPVTHIFEVTNTGKEPLKISNVVPSCGCTTPIWEQNKDIAPGQSSKITVGYNAASEGMFDKTITISYNNNQSKVIRIKGEVWKTPTESAPANKAIEGLKN
jgi:hypothetical protein